MMVDRQARKLLIETVAHRVIANAEELTDLDRAIGDGDHGINMRRGFEAVLAELEQLSAKNLGESLRGVGTTLVMKVGGASGPLYGTAFIRPRSVSRSCQSSRAKGTCWPRRCGRLDIG